MARRRRNSGASRLYAPAIKEQVNVVRLMNDDKANTGPYTGNSIAMMLVNAGLATYTSQDPYPIITVARDLKFKVISVIAQPGMNVELGGTGETFINNSTEKPMKVKIPKTDFIDAQWFNITAGAHPVNTGLGGIGGKNYDYRPFGGEYNTSGDAKAATFECITVGYCFI